MKLVAIVGTNAKQSYNRSLSQFMQRHFASKADIEILEITDVPMFNETEDQTDTPVIQKFNEAISEADGVIISTPEHNHTIPSSLNSLLEWLSFNIHPLDGKPTMIVGASLGLLGTSRAQAHLRQILDAPELKARVMPGTEFFLGHSEQVLDDDYNLNNPEKVAELEEHFAEFQNFVELTKALVKPEDTNRKKSFIWEEWLKA